MSDEGLSDAIAVISLIHNRMRQRLLWRHLGKHGLKGGTLMALPGCEAYRDPGAFIATARMDFGGPATPRAAESLCGVPAVFFNAPAAC